LTDEDHRILDCNFGAVPDVPAIARKLGDMLEIIEHGLFFRMANVVLIGRGQEVAEWLGDG